ncbi:MAG: hypothetical protein A2140_03775 [Candidatus Muproteobacteria bacterium RBG_16_62_13]|uniref:Autotransporter domain-containing protein n=1 Tax=Candidatus Muproteobacteria bacterium RBG_16_62_13 TaxID=1817756 RepID=A0A1F6T3I8_9PROT|nr:MAG: hypothetical protein A2140_03775 [Candidatus Muproteobacteria bacterium RBG_16_62_13]
MKKNRIAHAVWCACALQLAMTVAPGIVHAQDWQPQLADAGARKPADPIRINLPQLQANVLQRLALELDDVDVTQTVARQGNQLTFTPPQPLSFGDHQLRLVEHGADGSITERGLWKISVRKTAAFRDASLQGNVTINIVRRVADKNLAQPEPDKGQYTGAAQLQGVIADGNWKITGQMDLIANHPESLMPRGVGHGQVDVGNFLFTGENGPVIAKAGHHSVGPDSLIMQSFTRRGVSVGMQSNDKAHSVTGFSLRSQDVVGAQEGFGIGDSENRTDGLVITSRPISSRRDAMAVSATVLSGEGPAVAGATGTGTSGDSTIAAGRAAGIVADGNLLDRRMRLRGEYAVTRYDFDGSKGRDTDLNGTIDVNQDAEKDKAYAALMTWTPWTNKMVNNKPLVWNMGVENKRLGTFFKSPANPLGVADRELVRTFTDVNYSGFTAQLSLGRETDNVNDIALLPQTESLQTVLSLSFTPQQAQVPGPDGKTPPPPWYGQPTFNATLIKLDQDVEKAGATLTTGALNETQNVSLTATFTYPTWSWSLGHTRGENTNFRQTAVDTKNSMTQFNANFRVGQKLTLGPTVQYNKIKETDPPTGITAKDTDTTTAGLNLGYQFTPKLNGNLGLNLNKVKTTDNSQQATTHDATGSLNWNLAQPQGARPGVTVSLEGQLHDVDDRITTTNTINNYQVFLKVAVSWLPTL